ncbi:MFS transporter [Bradyrhizobium sp. CCGB12]|uniref:MFS transporter n=1 Tax=Bradyrhizobium sp. CCGB12 TaxID=2949632 RepID=UPI0020B3736F|nr:MFS transporter [Bradyrhizobium sp. CCGB12]MCP3387735.1 MFS transporter [Bradyrhizobium sp. CCGB12]
MLQATTPLPPPSAELIAARLDRLPVTRRLSIIRIVIGAATFFDAYTVLAIAFAMPVLVREWSLSPAEVGAILSLGYVGQLIGAVFFGWLAERIGRIKVLWITITLFVGMDIACLFATGAVSMMLCRFVQGIGTGGEVPVASAYVNEMIGSRKRGRFFLLYEVIFPVGLMFAGVVGYFLVPLYGWRAMFLVGLVPSVLMFPLPFLMPESPRWLAARGRLAEADAVVSEFEQSAERSGHVLAEPSPLASLTVARTDWHELFRGIYRGRTFMIWTLWFCAYMVLNGMITWMPTLYREVFKLPLETSLAYGFTTSACGVVASIVCALLIDRVGRRNWYAAAFALAVIPLALLAITGADTVLHVLVLVSTAYAIVQTIAFSMYLYSAELYPTRLRALGTGCGSAWLRLGSSTGPLVVGYVSTAAGIGSVFAVFGCVLALGAVVTWAFAVETAGKSLETLSP